MLSIFTFFESRPKAVHALAVFLLLFLVVGMFWRVVFLGETLVDAATLQNQLPWGATGVTFLDHSYNRRDITDTYITREYFLVDSYKRGELPMWSPYNLGGHPVYADGVLRMLSPFNVLYLWFDVPRAYDLTCVLQLFLTGLFAYVFFVGIGLRPAAALLGATTFVFASLTLFHVTSSGWLGGLMWLPLIFLGCDRAIERRSTPWAVFAGTCLAMQFYCGYMPNAIYYLGAVVTYFGFRVFGARERLFELVKYAGCAVVAGMALSAAQWMPIFELLGYSNRKIVPTELAPNWLPPWYLSTAVFPHLFGTGYDPKFAVLFVGLGVSHAHSVYFSIAGLCLAAFAVYLWFHRRATVEIEDSHRRRLSYFLFLLALSTFVMCAVPLYVHVTKYIPVLQTIRVTNRVSVLFTFSAAALVAYGAHFLLVVGRERVDDFLKWMKRFAVPIFGASVALTAAVSISAQTSFYQGLMLRFDQQRRMVRAPLALSENFDVANLDYFPGTLMPLIFLALVLWTIFAWRRGRLAGSRLLVALFGLLALDLFWNGGQFNETYDRSLVYKPCKAIEFLQKDPDLFRVLVAPANFSTKGQAGQLDKIVAPPNTLVPYRIQTVSGKDQLFPRWYREMTSAVHAQNYLSHIVFNTASSPWHDLWNVKYVMTDDQTRFPDDGYVERFVGDGVRIYENTRAKPRAFFIPHAVAMPDTPLSRVKGTVADEVVKRMKAPDFNPLETAFVQGEDATGEIRHVPDGDDVKVVSYRNNEVTIRTASKTEGVLVLSDTWYPGWKAYVDGVERPLWRADHALRAVRLDAGEHRVEFRFEPVRFRVGCWTSLAALVCVVGYSGYLWIFRRTTV